jgi:uncharacterized protein involved in outer membrane biogenesis
MATTLDPRSTTGATPPPPHRRRGPARWHAPLAIVLGILAWLIGLIVVAWLVLFITHGRFLKARFERMATGFMGRDVRVAGDFQLYFDIINVKFVADGMTIANLPFASKPYFFSAKHIDTRISTIRLIFGEQHARWLNLDGASIDAEWDKAHQHNTWSFGGTAPLKIPLVDRAAVTDTTVRYRDPKMGVFTDHSIGSVSGTNVGGTHINDAIRFSGSGTYKGRPFDDSGALFTPNSTMAEGRTRIELRANQGATHLDLKGSLPTLTSIAGATADFSIRGPNLRELFDLAHIVVPDTRGYSLVSHFEQADGEYRFTKLAGRIGNSDIGGSMTASLPNNRPTLKADLASRAVDIVDIGPLIGFDPNKIATQGAVAAATTQGTPSGGHPRILPDAPLRIEEMKAFDAHVVYKVGVIKAPHVPISNLALTLDLDHNLLKLSPMTMDVANTGHLAADITLDARGAAVVTDYDIRLSPTPLGGLMKGFGLTDSGTTGTIKARIKMTGTGDSVRKSLATSNGRIAIGLPKGTFWTSYAQLSEFDVGVFLQKLLQGKLKQPITINCGLIAFTVNDGIARTDPVLIDTDKNVMTANGGFSFKDESFNVEFRSRGKKFSAFSGQSPVGIGGWFAAPALHIVSAQLVERVGAAVAVGVVASPVAPILAFIDLGRTPDTACGPVLEGATAAAQHTEKGGAVKGIGDKADNHDKAAQPKKKFLGIF